MVRAYGDGPLSRWCKRSLYDARDEVFVRLSRIGSTSVTYEYHAWQVEDDVLMVTAQQTLVLVDLKRRSPMPIPPEFRRVAAAFEGEALGHPLIASARLVRNDVCLDASTRLLVVSGSNMSGKSTLLRTVGTAAVSVTLPTSRIS